MTEFEFLDCSVHGGIATVHLTRPPVHAVTQPMYAEIQALFSDIGRLAPGVRAIVLAGHGTHSCGRRWRHLGLPKGA